MILIRLAEVMPPATRRAFVANMRARNTDALQNGKIFSVRIGNDRYPTHFQAAQVDFHHVKHFKNIMGKKPVRDRESGASCTVALHRHWNARIWRRVWAGRREEQI